MRRVVPSRLRKKALFSCDRCKSKKVACKRTIDGASARQEDTRIPCVACSKRGLQCTTTIERKKRHMGPVENIGLHYRCLISLAEGLFPDVDVNNIDLLIELGVKLQIDMPSRSNPDESSVDEMYALGYTINSNLKSPLQGKNEETVEHDKFILDSAGVSHYIGPRGAATFLAFTSDLMKKNTTIVSNTFKANYDRVYNEEIIVSSSQNPLNGSMFKEIDMTQFPLVHLDRGITDINIEVFFSKIFPYYPCFSEARFMTLYNKMWGKERTKLTSGEVCLVYLIKIMGYYYQSPIGSNGEAQLISQLVNIVRLSLAEFMLTPTIDGILCLFFLSVFFGKNKRRECGYLLITLAARQAVAIGLNRQSMIECNPGLQLQEEMKRIWWAIFEQEVKQSNLLGRVSSLSLEEVTVDLPLVQNDVDSFFLNAIKLSKIVYMINQNNPKFSGSFELGVKERSQTVAIKLQFSEWLKETQGFLTSNNPNTVAFKYRLNLEHKYYYISSLCPFIMNLTKKQKLQEINEFDLQMVIECINLTFDCLQLLVDADQVNMSNAFWSPHIMYAYECVLCLCNTYIWMSDNYCPEIKDSLGNIVTIEQVEMTMKAYREYNAQHLRRSKGSISKLSKHIEVMLSSFNFMDDASDRAEVDLMYMQSLNRSPFILAEGIDDKFDKFASTFSIDDIFFGDITYT